MQNRYERCPNCMNVIQGQEEVCQSCGFDFIHYEEKSACLKPFTVLQNKYMIGRVIGVGGFGITYIGWDLNLQTYIAIKEYFPDSIAGRDTATSPEVTQVVPNESKVDIYNKGLKRYVEEARNLSKFYNLQGIVSVKDFFYENGTGYIVMEYINGINLKEFLNNSGGKLDEGAVLALMRPVLESLYQIHNSGLVHRDISPDNIMVDGNGKIKLIDFGSARGESADSDKTYTVILKHGYAPSEQYYAKGKQGPWTDIYSLCATMYKMLTGQVPPNSIERMENDAYVPPSYWGAAVSPRTEAVIAKGLAVKSSDRYQNIGDMLADLYGEKPVELENSMSVNSASAYSSPVSQRSLSQQSMHLDVNSMNNVGGKNNNNGGRDSKKALVIGATIAGVAILALVLVLAMSSGSKKKDENENTTEPTTTDTDASSEDVGIDVDDELGELTEAVGETDIGQVPDNTTEPGQLPGDIDPSQGLVYQWPTAMSDDWKDYIVNLNGTLYKFPIPYTEFVNKGWRAETLPAYVASGDTATIEFSDGSLPIEVVVANYSAHEVPLDQCLIIGFQVNSRYDTVSDKAVLELAGGVRLFETTKSDAKKVYGSPDYTYDGTDYGYEEIAYYSKGYDKGLDLEFDIEDGKLVCVGMLTNDIPEGLTGSVDDIDTEPPEINALYVAPSGPSKDRSDNIITLDGVNYQLPCPVSEFINNGWVLDDDTEDYISAASYESSISTNIEKDGNKVEVTIENLTTNAILPQNGLISEITVESKYCDIPVVFPGGITMGDDGSKISEVYSDMESYSEEDYSSFKSYRVNMYIGEGLDKSVSIGAYADPETNKINKYTYSESGFNLE